MEEKNLQEVMELINRIAEGEYDPPEPEDVAEVNRLTGQDWTAEDLRLICCEYWSHNSLEETAYQLIHGDLPVVRETDLAFWRAKSGAALDAAAVYRKYCTGGAMLEGVRAGGGREGPPLRLREPSGILERHPLLVVPLRQGRNRADGKALLPQYERRADANFDRPHGTV